MIRIGPLLSLVTPLDIEGQPRFEQCQSFLRQRQTSGQTTAEHPAAEPPDAERLVPWQPIGIDEDRTHFDARLLQQLKHGGEAFAIDHHHRITPLRVASADAQVQFFQ